MHPSLEYALVWCVAAAGVLLLTPLARLLAQRWGAIARPRERDVHAFAIPRLGGVAIYAGFGLAILVAHSLPTLRTTFTAGNQIAGVMAAGAVLLVPLFPHTQRSAETNPGLPSGKWPRRHW